jgi:hypothetical protein
MYVHRVFTFTLSFNLGSIFPFAFLVCVSGLLLFIKAFMLHPLERALILQSCFQVRAG